jgi:hypothetical protein
MRLSPRTLDKLTAIITGDGGVSPYRGGPRIIEFFNALGWRESYDQSFGSRNPHTRAKLDELNGTSRMAATVLGAFDFWGENGFNCEAAATEFNKVLVRDGYRIAKEAGQGWFEDGRFVDGAPHFVLKPIGGGTVAPAVLAAVGHATLREQVAKCQEKIANGDCSGAITNAYTLIEALLKDLLRKNAVTFKEDEGDIRSLYSALKGPLHLDPKTESLDVHLKTILDGFQKLIGGLYAVANKASDRHDRRYEPAPHHAKLVVNSAFALGEFLCDTNDYQRARHTGALP